MKDFIPHLIDASLKAGDAIMEVYAKSDRGVELKDDRSPLTEADKRSHEILFEALQRFNIPVLSEEGEQHEYNTRKNWDRLWIVDPLDGTKEFLHRNGEFTTNIALIENGVPVLGVIYAPAIDELYWGTGNEAFMKKNGVTTPLSGHTIYRDLDALKKAASLKVVASRSHLNDDTRDFLSDLKEPEVVSMGSSLKLMMVARGDADVYPRFAPTMEWDIAAGDAIVRASGKKVLQANGLTPLVYNKEDLLNPYFFCF